MADPVKGDDVFHSTDPGEPRPYLLRRACVTCGGDQGYLKEQNGQQVAYCGECDRYQYCAPKAETGLPQRSVSDRPVLKPAKRARILDRDHGQCAVCNRADGVMHIGHLLSVEDGRALGATDAELWDDANLCVMCEECNLGFGRLTVSVPLLYRVLQVRAKRNG